MRKVLDTRIYTPLNHITHYQSDILPYFRLKYKFFREKSCKNQMIINIWLMTIIEKMVVISRFEIFSNFFKKYIVNDAYICELCVAEHVFITSSY